MRDAGIPPPKLPEGEFEKVEKAAFRSLLKTLLIAMVIISILALAAFLIGRYV